MAILNTQLLGLPYAGADTDETYDVLARLFVKDGQKLTLPEIVDKYTPTIGTVYIKAADWTAADGTADAYDAKITISGVEPNSMILIYPATDSDAEKAKRLGIRAKAASGLPNDDTFVIVRATGGDPTVTEGIVLVYIALRGYAVWNEGNPLPFMPYAAVIGVDPYIATVEGDRDDIAASQRLVTEAVTALRSSLSTLSTGLADTNKALELRLKSADLPNKLDEYRAAKGLIDKTVSDLVNYYAKDQTLTKDEINALVSAVPKFKIEVVTSLPTSNISDTTVYLVKSGSKDSNLYTEYIRAGGKWEKLGTQTVDLTGYATEAWVNDILASYVKTVDMEAYVTELLDGYLTKEDADKTYQPAGDYAKHSDIPTKTSQLTNDSGFLTQHQSLAHLLPKDQGTANAGKLMAVGKDGQVVYIDAPAAGSDIIGNFTEDGGIELYKDLPTGTYTLYTVDSNGNRVKYATMVVTSHTNILTSGDATVHPNQRWSGSEKILKDCDGMICVEIPASAVNGKTLYFKGFAKGLYANHQGAVWMAVNADNTLNGRLLQTTDNQGNVWTCAALVYDDATTVGSLKIDSSTFAGIATAAKLRLNIAVYESAAITTLPDTLIMTIDEPIE